MDFFFFFLPVNWQVILCMVCDIDKNYVSFSDINSRPWIPPINSYNRFCMAQSTNILHLNLQNKQTKGQKKKTFIKERTKDSMSLWYAAKMVIINATQPPTSNWYLFMAASAGDERMPRNEKRRIVKLKWLNDLS